MAVSPVLSAMMCDGMGWFAETDYKRILLAYDQVYYLLPEETVEFRDVYGDTLTMFFPLRLQQAREFVAQAFRPDEGLREVLMVASRADAADLQFSHTVSEIPSTERLYTWRVANSDGDIAAGRSLGLKPDEDVLAHAVLLNKFLLAADRAGCIPITGKPYIQKLLSVKYKRAVSNLADHLPGVLPLGIRDKDIRHDAVLQRVVSVFVPDEELSERTFDDILAFKAANWQLFERFSLLTRSLVDAIKSLPSERTFSKDIQDIISTEVWKKKAEVETNLRTAWRDVFKSGLKDSANSDVVKDAVMSGLGGIALGVVPALTLGSLTVAAVLGPAAASTSWAISKAVDYFAKRSTARENGLYYIMRFAK
jgi:hypothetical protein